MAFLVFHEKKSFSYKDFLKFEVDGNIYGMKHGTFRNKITKLRKKGEVERLYCSPQAFYTLKGHKFGKPVTPNHMVVSSNNSFYKFLQELPLDKQSIHDIRLKFKVTNIWKVFSINPEFHKNNRSNDIMIRAWNKGNTIVKIIIHKTDTVSIIVGCSLQPFRLDVNGIIEFFTILARIEERLKNIVEDSIPIDQCIKCNQIPDFRSWIATMWHFGRDGLAEFNGEKFSMTINYVEIS